MPRKKNMKVEEQVEFVGMQNTFGESGQPEELLEKYGMSVKSIKETVRNVKVRKN